MKMTDRLAAKRRYAQTVQTSTARPDRGVERGSLSFLPDLAAARPRLLRGLAILGLSVSCSLAWSATVPPAAPEPGTPAAHDVTQTIPPMTATPPLRGTGDLGIAIERARGSLQWLDGTRRVSLGRIEGLGDLSHASAVFSRDARYAFVFGRDGGLSKVDLLTGKVVKRILQAGNSIGGAISQDGRYVAAANYTPGGVRIFDSETLESVADIATDSKVVGLEDVPGNRFAFSLWDKGEIWLADLSQNPRQPQITRYSNIGQQPYDALISPDGRWYVAGLYGEDGIAVLDTWNPEAGVKRALPDYGRGTVKLPVYKMPHLETWAIVGNLAFIPGVGRHEVIIVDVSTWQKVGAIPVAGQPVFVMAQPDGRRLWVNFAFPHYDSVQITDVPSQRIVHTIKPGKAVLHMEFTPRGESVWLSVRDANRLEVYDTRTLQRQQEIAADAPSGIFFTWRAHRFGL